MADPNPFQMASFNRLSRLNLRPLADTSRLVPVEESVPQFQPIDTPLPVDDGTVMPIDAPVAETSQGMSTQTMLMIAGGISIAVLAAIYVYRRTRSNPYDDDRMLPEIEKGDMVTIKQGDRRHTSVAKKREKSGWRLASHQLATEQNIISVSRAVSGERA